MSTRRRLAMVVAVVGVVVVGNHLAGVWPRTVQISYEVGERANELDVDYVLGGNAIASARFTQPAQKTPVFRHSVDLRPGEYQVQITVYPDDAIAFQAVRSLIVPTDGITRFQLENGPQRAE